MLLRDVMTRNPQEIPPQATLKEAAEKMKQNDIGATRLHDEHLCSEALERISEPAQPHA